MYIGRKDTRTPAFTAACFTAVKKWKPPQCPLTDSWIQKTWYIHTEEHYPVIKSNEIMPLAATWIDAEVK